MNITGKFKYLVFVIIIIVLFTGNVSAFNYDDWIKEDKNQKLVNILKDRAKQSNNWYCNLKSELNDNDKLTKKQLNNRVKWIIQYSYQLNNSANNISPRQFAKEFYFLIEHESHFVNYKTMDDGKSFGITAITWKVAQLASDYFGDNLYVYDRVKNENDNYEIKYDKKDRRFLRNNVEYQVMYGVYYGYKLFNKYYQDENDTYTVWTGYNVGPGLDTNSQRFRNYYFSLRGRLDYFYDEINKKMN